MLGLPLTHRGQWAGHTISKMLVSLSKMQVRMQPTQEPWETQAS